MTCTVVLEVFVGRAIDVKPLISIQNYFVREL